ncbi:MAG: hypothetical protein ACQGVC_03495, partial [Myxococcota bacterium]
MQEAAGQREVATLDAAPEVGVAAVAMRAPEEEQRARQRRRRALTACAAALWLACASPPPADPLDAAIVARGGPLQGF